MIIEATQSVPLTIWEDGSIRVKGTRLLVDMIIHAHNRAECPEEIFEAFPADSYTVADIYSVIAYYLRNKEKLDLYLKKREKGADEFWNIIEADPKHQVRRKELRERMIAFRKDRA
jgi:uncharacterized protein (DUF433 family)